MEANSLPGSRERRFRVPRRVLRLRYDEPSVPFGAHLTSFAVGGDGLRGKDLCFALVSLATLYLRLSQESTSKTLRFPDLLVVLAGASVRLESLLIVA